MGHPEILRITWQPCSDCETWATVYLVGAGVVCGSPAARIWPGLGHDWVVIRPGLSRDWARIGSWSGQDWVMIGSWLGHHHTAGMMQGYRLGLTHTSWPHRNTAMHKTSLHSPCIVWGQGSKSQPIREDVTYWGCLTSPMGSMRACSPDSQSWSHTVVAITNSNLGITAQQNSSAHFKNNSSQYQLSLPTICMWIQTLRISIQCKMHGTNYPTWGDTVRTANCIHLNFGVKVVQMEGLKSDTMNGKYNQMRFSFQGLSKIKWMFIYFIDNIPHASSTR